jgi:orotidine-5'-phosphate decarboxylase
MNDSFLCIGLDPVAAKLPSQLKGSVLDFTKAIIDATADLVCCYKPNFAFYGSLGEAGWSILRATMEHIPPSVPIIVDAKVGDIGSTAERYAHMFFSELGADALTVNPYMGHDAVEPFLLHEDRGILLLCLTSNKGAEDLETLVVDDGRPLFERVAEKATAWNTRGNIGLVVGATRAESIRDLRALAADLPFLIPGVGAQGGDLESAVVEGQLASGGGVIINASRSVIYASDGVDFQEAARNAALALHSDIKAARRQLTAAE